MEDEVSIEVSTIGGAGVSSGVGVGGVDDVEKKEVASSCCGDRVGSR